MKCNDFLYIYVGNGSPWKVICELEQGHDCSHEFYGDNYKIMWLKKEHTIENYGSEPLTDDLKKRCKGKLIIENMMVGIF